MHAHRNSLGSYLKKGHLMRRSSKLNIAVVLIVMSLMAVVPAFAQGPNEFDDDWSFADFVPCANGGAGEWVVVSGTIHFNEAGSGFRVNLQQASGVGQTTGDVYQAIGAGSITLIDKNGADVYTYVDHFRLIGRGPGNNLQVSEVFHVTYNANGELTATVDSYSVECR